MTIFSDPSVTALFTIPRADWDAINTRTSTVIQASGIAEIISHTLPHFPALVTVCESWVATTYPALIASSSQVASLSATAIETLNQVQNVIATAGDEPLSPSTLDQVQTLFDKLRTPTTAASATAADLVTQIRTFATANAMVDSEVEGHIGILGPGWQFLGSTMGSVEAAAGLVEGGWSAISSDLDNMVDGSLPISAILSLEIQSALQEWQTINVESTAFPSLAPPASVATS